MKPTDDERREVAENLRNMCTYGCSYKEQFYDLLDETVMNDWDFHEFRDVADRLADLIEPEPERTCHNDLKESDHRGVWPIPHFKCSSCGEMFSTCDFDYCPNCGAKVVMTND